MKWPTVSPLKPGVPGSPCRKQPTTLAKTRFTDRQRRGEVAKVKAKQIHDLCSNFLTLATEDAVLGVTYSRYDHDQQTIISLYKVYSSHSCTFTFWSTVCKTVRPMLSDRCLSCLSVCLSVTLVYSGQTVGWIKMKLGMQVGLGPCHIVLDRTQFPQWLKYKFGGPGTLKKFGALL